MRVGIDVGGTNTDAVLMDDDRVLAEVKRSTSPDVTSGIVAALHGLIDQSNVERGQIQAVMIGTTHFTNALVEARRLLPVAAIRLGLPATRALPPLVDWPDRLRDVVGANVYLCRGGHEFDGREIAKLDRSELHRVAEDMEAKGLRTAAISSVFSPINNECEQEAARILRECLPDVAISLSSEIGRIGLLERENATIINASLADLAVTIVAGFRSALVETGIDAPVYLSQNDGTLMTVEFAERYPVATFASGPTNSMRGAALLSGETDCAVVDIGGTTSDIGMLQQGFPREAKSIVEVAGVKTNFRMPDVLSLGIGGGSLVRSNGAVTVGPDSVGYELTTRARIFSGDVLTATDVAVAGGLASIGDPAAVSGLDRALLRQTLALIESSIAEAVDRMKTDAGPIPVVVVGGGSILLGDSLPGASKLVRPEHFAVANAIGAAIAQVGGEIDQMFSTDTMPRAEALERAKAEAVKRAVAAGAIAGTVQIVDVEELAIAYIPGNAVRIKVKAVGDLDLGRQLGAVHR